MDVLRARAFMDILLGMDSRPLGTKPDGSQAQTPAPAPGSAPGPGGPLAGMIPPGFAGHVTLTIPAATLIARGPAGRARRDRACRPQSWSKYIRSLPGLVSVDAGIRHINVPDRNLSNQMRHQAAWVVCGEVVVWRVAGGWLIHALAGSDGG